MKLDPQMDLLEALGAVEAPRYPPSGAIQRGIFRYRSWRVWDQERPWACWILLHPTPTDPSVDDPTTTRLTELSRALGYGGWVAVYLFAYTATRFSEIQAASARGEDAIGLDTDIQIQGSRSLCQCYIAAWGSSGTFMDRDQQVMDNCRAYFGGPRTVHALHLEADGSPSLPENCPDNPTMSIYEGRPR